MEMKRIACALVLAVALASFVSCSFELTGTPAIAEVFEEDLISDGVELDGGHFSLDATFDELMCDPKEDVYVFEAAIYRAPGEEKPYQVVETKPGKMEFTAIRGDFDHADVTAYVLFKHLNDDGSQTVLKYKEGTGRIDGPLKIRREGPVCEVHFTLDWSADGIPYEF